MHSSWKHCATAYVRTCHHLEPFMSRSAFGVQIHMLNPTSTSINILRGLSLFLYVQYINDPSTAHSQPSQLSTSYAFFIVSSEINTYKLFLVCAKLLESARAEYVSSKITVTAKMVYRIFL